MAFNHMGTTELFTERLQLRCFNMNDADSMLKNWIADKTIQRNYGEPTYKSKEEVFELLSKWISSYSNKDFYRWAVIHKKTNENIGQIAFCKVYSDIATAEIE